MAVLQPILHYVAKSRIFSQMVYGFFSRSENACKVI